MAMTPDVVTVGEVAAFMRVSRETVYRLPARVGLPGRKIGRIWRFPKDAIQRFVQQQSAATSLTWPASFFPTGAEMEVIPTPFRAD